MPKLPEIEICSGDEKSDMVAAYIGLGSNLDDPAEQLRRALGELDQVPNTRLVAASSFYRSPPMDGMDQPDYINAVVKLDTSLDPQSLLAQLQAVETAHGRVRGERWGARTLDLDLLVYGEETIKMPNLTVPHPGIHERAFVLYPLNEIAPDLDIPGHGCITELLNNCSSCGLIKI